MILILVLMAGSVWAEPASWTLSLQLPDGNTVGLWKVSPERAWGVEFHRNGYSTTAVEGPDTKPYRDKDGDLIVLNDSQALTAEASCGIRDFRRYRQDIAPFVFYGLSGSIIRIRWPYEAVEKRVRIAWKASAEIGFGVQWKPWSRVGFWISQGIHAYLGRTDKGAAVVEGVSHKLRERNTSVGISPPRVLAFFIF